MSIRREPATSRRAPHTTLLEHHLPPPPRHLHTHSPPQPHLPRISRLPLKVNNSSSARLHNNWHFGFLFRLCSPGPGRQLHRLRQLFAVGSTSFPLTTPSNTSTSSLSLSSTTNSTSIQSIILPSSLPIRLTLSTGQSLFASIPDLTFLSSSTTSSSSSSSSIKVLKTESTTCTIPCSTGGICTLAGTCSCASGFTGQTCNICLPGFYGPSCAKCPAGCKVCDDGIAGTGNCLDGRTVNSTTLASACNCSNGACLTTSTSTSTSTSGTCACNAGWTTAANGTQCAACSAGYYLTSTGDCLACDPTCASCSSPSGVCLTCQTGLSPSSSSPNTCLTSTTALSNGTFTTCPSRTFFSSSTSSCTSCNPVCETCYGCSTNECLVVGVQMFCWKGSVWQLIRRRGFVMVVPSSL
ncbi:hypothetical protein T439DRAFT_94635 [Meredithblackwellia eburnea MCA 4105]